VTCIVAVKDVNGILLAGDTAGTTSDWGLKTRKDLKVFRAGPAVIGFTSSFRMGQLLRYRCVVPDIQTGRDAQEYMATEFIDAVRLALRNGGWMTQEKSQETGGQFIVGVAGRIFCVHTDFSVEEAADEYSACGAGAEVALGSLYSTRFMPVSAETRAMWALQAAAHFNASVRGPFYVLRPNAVMPSEAFEPK